MLIQKLLFYLKLAHLSKYYHLSKTWSSFMKFPKFWHFNLRACHIAAKFVWNTFLLGAHTSNFTNKVGSGLLNQGFNIAVVFVDTFGMHSKSSQCNTRLGTNRNRTSKNWHCGVGSQLYSLIKNKTTLWATFDSIGTEVTCKI